LFEKLLFSAVFVKKRRKNKRLVWGIPFPREEATFLEIGVREILISHKVTLVSGNYIKKRHSYFVFLGMIESEIKFRWRLKISLFRLKVRKLKIIIISTHRVHIQ